MALPLIAGIAVGSLAVIAFNNKDEIKEKLSVGAKKTKEGAEVAYEKTKEVAKSAKEKLSCKKSEETKEVLESKEE